MRDTCANPTTTLKIADFRAFVQWRCAFRTKTAITVRGDQGELITVRSRTGRIPDAGSVSGSERAGGTTNL